MSSLHTRAAVAAALRDLATEERAASSARFFKTGAGQYGAGDVFIGVDVPAQRKVAKAFAALPLEELIALLASPIHEERLTALLIMVDQFEHAKKDPARRAALFDAYLTHRERVNNWDLVDSSAAQIVGGHLIGQTDRSLLDRLAESHHLWSRRIAMIATHHFIRAGQFGDTLRLSAKLLRDEHDLIHKATGWMLREVGERDRAVLDRFLADHAGDMPRTMLRYAIEKYETDARTRWLKTSPAPARPRATRARRG